MTKDDEFGDQLGDDRSHSRPPLSLRQIEVFRSIMLAGSISAAGRALHVSQPAISRVLALTEKRLGYPLFERARGGLIPTPEAKRLYAEVEEIYSQVQRVNALATSLGSEGEGQLKLISSSSFGQKVVPTALSYFCAHNRAARLDYRQVTFDQFVFFFLSGQADIGVSMSAADHPYLSSTRVGQEQVVCVIPRAHPLAHSEFITAEAITASSNWIGYPPNTPMYKALTAFFGANGPAVPPSIEVRTPVAAYFFAHRGLGPALVDRSCIAGPSEELVVRPIDPPAHIDIWVTRSLLTPLPLLARRFVAALKKSLEES